MVAAKYTNPMNMRSYTCSVSLDPNTSEAWHRFNNPDGGAFAMLVSTRAAGQGLNLTGADTVILYDLDFNPAIDRQAEARLLCAAALHCRHSAWFDRGSVLQRKLQHRLVHWRPNEHVLAQCLHLGSI